MEDGVQQLELIRAMGRSLTFDPWAQAVETFDLHIPSYKSPRKNATWRDHFSAVTQTGRNWFMNAKSMFQMAQDHGFSGVKIKSAWSPKIFSVRSTQDSAWVAPIRKGTLASYIQLNQAVADGDEKTIKRLTINNEQQHFLSLARNRDKSRVYLWKLHGERTPCRVVSIRCAPTNLDVEVRNGGSRLIVQVLVRFDTLQSLEVYSKKGTLLTGQSEPKPVVEYLVFQKRMWYDTPWVVRDRFFESVEAKFESTF
ncbi:hypothetical protein B0H21DRAFT_326375 [Amylocystis lapponica]|nr:hypothetical protein B0H21DRAFT_326375 [Amylocystis lapponica]